MMHRRRTGVGFGEVVSPSPRGVGYDEEHCPSPEIIFIMCLEMVHFCKDLCIQNSSSYAINNMPKSHIHFIQLMIRYRIVWMYQVIT